MKKPVLRKTSNPKKPEEYLKMFEKLKKYALGFIHYLWEKDEHFNLHGMRKAYENNDAFNDVIEKALVFYKNDRIESYLKFMRAKMCQGWLNEIKADKVLKPEVSISYPELEEYCNKEIQNYLAKTEKTQAETSSSDTLKVGSHYRDLLHFIDLYNSDKNKYREINEYSWTNKTPSKIIYDLSEIEDKIKSQKDFNDREYQEKLKRASSTEEYLKMDNTYTWYIIESDRCQFEAYLNDHCGTDSSADVLFSLRSKKNNVFNSHVTISASIQNVDETKHGTPAVFVVRQVKGKGNNKPNERYWDYIVKLFESEEFGWQERSSYRSDSDFHIDDLNQNEMKKFLKLKPYWNNSLKAKIHYDLLNIKNTKVLTPEYWKASSTNFSSDMEFTIRYDYFEAMLRGLGQYWGGREDYLTNLAIEIDEYYPHSDMSSLEYHHEIYMEKIKEEKPKLYKKIIKAMEKLEFDSILEAGNIKQSDFSNEDKEESLLYSVYEAMERAYADGESVGTRDNMEKAYINFFDQLELEKDGSVIGIINKTSQHGWEVTIYPEAISDYCEEIESFGIPAPDPESFKTSGRNSVEWDWDYNEDVALERLLEELPND